jgi:hypothetical protein
MVAVPADNGDITPDVELIDATAELLDDHVPPDTVDVNVAVLVPPLVQIF